MFLWIGLKRNWEQKDLMNRVTILGASAAVPTRERDQSGQYLQLSGHTILIDCGEGTQNRLIENNLSYQKITHIFISHLHADHFMGIFTLVNTMGMQQRDKKLTIVSPPGIRKMFDVLHELTESEMRFPVEFIELENELPVIELDRVYVTPFLVKHRIPCYGYRFQEKDKERTLLVDECIKHDIPVQYYAAIKKGQDWMAPDGTVVGNGLLTSDPPEPVSYVYITDTLFDEKWVGNARNASLLYHEATYLDNLVDKAHDRFHATAREAAIFARKAGVKHLIIGHFSGKYGQLEDHLNEARKEFPNTDLAEQGHSFVIQ